MNRSAASLLLSMALLLGPLALAAEEPAAQPSRAAQDRGNICFGGYEHGKLIPPDDKIDNPFTQTTLFGCAVESGAPTFLPDLKPKVAGGVMS